MTSEIPTQVDQHVRDFNQAVRDGDFTGFVAGFSPDAVMRFSGIPAGPFHGCEAITRAYAGQPPDDTMSVRARRVDSDRHIVRFAWDKGGSGQLALRWRDGRLTRLDIAFDPHDLPTD